MAFSFIENTLCQRFLSITLNKFSLQTRNRYFIQKTKLRHPTWHIQKQRVIHEDYITPENKDFIKEVIKDRYEIGTSVRKLHPGPESPLQTIPQAHGEWTPFTRRTGLIARKIGDCPLWDNNGRRVLTTLLQVADNHVIKYTPPEEYEPAWKPEKQILKKKFGCLLVGAENADPSLLTREYFGLFDSCGVMPKKNICRFYISPSAALAPGTPLLASHFRVGDIVDVRGKTIDHGFQGVVKRWGFKGMPASHGVTKTHRRPGNIGGGGEKARVWPGKKMPGHMGNRWRVLRGVRILRINTKYNVLWVEGVGIPGPTNGLVYMFDTVLPLKKLQTAPPFPTYFENGDEEEDIYHESIHPFKAPTITFSE